MGYVIRGLLLGALLSAAGTAHSSSHSAVDVSAGYGFSCLVTASGGAQCWGRNDTGQLGDGTLTGRSAPAEVTGLATGVRAVSAGGGFSDGHACAVTSANLLQCWGSNMSWGQVGNGSGLTHTSPVVIELGADIGSVSAGARHTCAVAAGGSVACWGDNFFGQLGTGSFEFTGPPTAIPGLDGIVAVSSGGSHSCALNSAGGVKCWGYAFYGQLGENALPFSRVSPVQVLGLDAGVIEISAGGTHTCALTAAGGVKCWGDNFFGQLGDGTHDLRPAPVDVVGLSSGVVAISAGGDHTCALTAGGAVKCWGANHRGQLGVGFVDFARNTPADVAGLGAGVAAIALGYEHSCAVTDGGGAVCWGDNGSGQLGDGSTTTSAVPVPVSGFASGTQVIDFPAIANRILGDGPFNVTATASSGLPVAFSSLTEAVCTIAGGVVTPVATGTCTIAADQAGNAAFSPAAQVTRSFEIRALVANAAPAGLTAIRSGDLLDLKWRAEAGFDAYEVACDGDATVVTVGTVSARVLAPDRARSYRCTVRAVRAGEATAASRPAYSLAFALREMSYNGSMAVGDFDGNGLPELFGTLAGPDGLRVVPEESLGLGSLRSPGRAYRDLRIADLDGDGYSDIIANVYSDLSLTGSFARLYWGQRTGGYVEDLAFAERRIRGFGETIVVADFDNDGDLDIFIPQYTDLGPDHQNILLMNDGNRGFAERADALGVANRNWHSSLRVEGAQGVDFDGDGWIDIYSGSHLYRNMGGTFTDVREAMGLPLQFDEGAKFIDWNRDGKMDLLLQTDQVTSQGIVRLFENDGSRFVERSSVVTNFPSSRTKYGLFAADFDGDGTEDLVFPGGFDFAQSNIPPILLLNRGEGFESTEFLPHGYRVTAATLVVASAIRQDAANDIFIANGPITHLQSLLPQRPFVRVEVLDAQGRRNQHGRVVTMIDSDPRYGRVARAVDGGSGYMSQSDYPVTFAVADGVAAVQVEVRFKSGTVTAMAPVGSTLAVYEDGRAIVRAPSLALTVGIEGSGAGMVHSEPSGIHCSDDCMAVFEQGTSVSLAAAPDSASVFLGWSGACAGTGPCTVTMANARSVTATFGLRPAPSVTVVSSASSAPVGQAVTFRALVAGTPPPTGTLAFRNAGVAIPGCEAVPLVLGEAACTTTVVSAGAYVITVTYSGDDRYRPSSGAASVAVEAPASNIPRLVNLSTRQQVLTGDNVLIGGFAIGGSTPKAVVIRARGPSLAAFGITGVLADPTLQLVSSSGAILASNDNWADSPDAAAIQAVALAPASATESAIIATLPPGLYTAIVRGAGASTGVGIVEVFEADHPEVPLINISARGHVSTGENVMIGGFVIHGDAPQTVVVRARGPSLAAHGIAGALGDPVLDLVPSGGGATITNDQWRFHPNAAALEASGLAPAEDRESAILVTLDPGAYTAIVRGAGGSTGVAIVEVFAQ